VVYDKSVLERDERRIALRERHRDYFFKVVILFFNLV